MTVMRINKGRITALAATCCLLLIITKLQFILSNAALAFGLSTPLSSSRSSSTSTDDATDYSSPSSPSWNYTAGHNACQAYPAEDSDIVIVVKTGATEVFNKLPAQLLTFLQCAKNDLLILSDMEQDIGDHHIYDCLSNVVEDAKFNNSDFDLYEEQKRVKLMGEDIIAMGNRGSQGWALDKYKNIHIAQKAWELRPNKAWYFFMDADTYVFWSSFVPWLRRHDPNKRLYLGSGVPNDPPFAHGGSGYALSRGAMKQLVGKNGTAIAADFDMMVKDDCCGDKVLGKLLEQKKILLTNWDPLTSGQKPRRMGLGPKLWCQPVVTYHHMSPEEINEMWQFELGRLHPQTPLLLEELYLDYLKPGFTKDLREDWDNVSEDLIYDPPPEDTKKGSDSSTNPEHYAYKSLENCKRACKENLECYQWLWDERSCKLGKGFKLGHLRETRDDEPKFTSGWDFERMKEFIAKNTGCRAPLWEGYKGG